jgi:hypothetical protein
VTDVGSGDVVVLFGNGDGTFQSPVHSSVMATGGGGSAAGPIWLTIAALGNTAVPSIVIADDYSTSLLVDSIQLDGRLSPLVSLPIADGGWSFALVADLNCDGIPDLVNSDATNKVTAFLGSDDGSYVQAGTVDRPGYSQSLGDFNEDGVPDVIVAPFVSFQFTVFLGVGDGTFSDAGIDSEIGVGNDVWVIGDLNEDGHLDLLVFSGEGWGSNTILLGRGDGTFTFGPQPSLTTYETQVLHDLNGDGHLDYVGDTRSGFAVALGNGDGTFQPQVEFDPPLWLRLASRRRRPEQRWSPRSHRLRLGRHEPPDLPEQLPLTIS